MIAIELEKQIIAGTLEYAIHRLVEERIKIEPYEKKLKNDETGRPAYDPKVMLKRLQYCKKKSGNHWGVLLKLLMLSKPSIQQ